MTHHLVAWAGSIGRQRACAKSNTSCWWFGTVAISNHWTINRKGSLLSTITMLNFTNGLQWVLTFVIYNGHCWIVLMGITQLTIGCLTNGFLAKLMRPISYQPPECLLIGFPWLRLLINEDGSATPTHSLGVQNGQPVKELISGGSWSRTVKPPSLWVIARACPFRHTTGAQGMDTTDTARQMPRD